LLHLSAKRWPELGEITEKTIKLNPFDYPQAYFLCAVAQFNVGNLEASEKRALDAERLDTRNQFPGIQHLLGMLLTVRKDWDGAAKHLRDYVRLAPTASDADAARTQLAQVEKIRQQLASAKER